MNVEVQLLVKRAPSTLAFEIPDLGILAFVQETFKKLSMEGPWEAWYHFKDKLITPSQDGIYIRELASDLHLYSKYDHIMRERICNAVLSPEFPQLAYFITKIFNTLNDEQLNEVLSNLFDRTGMADPLKLVLKLKSMLTIQKIESAIRSQVPTFKGTVHEVFCYADLSKSEIEVRRQQNLNNIKRTAYHYAISVLDHFVNLFSLVFHLKNNSIDEGDPMTAEMQAHMQYTALMQNLSLISGWVIALSLYLANAVLTAAICGFTVIFGGAIVYLYYTFLKPCPENVAPFKNIITEVNRGAVPPVAGREKEIQEVINCLCSNDSNTRNHPLLVGATGVGKTQIVQGLAHRIAEGNVPDLLKGKKLFVVNTTDLVTGSAWGKLWNLEKMLHIMKGHESDAIFFFDEIHVAFNKEENIDLGQKLKTIMDPGPGNLQFCIGATTLKEYNQFIERDVAFTRRTHRIDVASMTPAEIQFPLLQRVYDELPNTLVDNGIVEKLANLSMNNTEFAQISQPYKSISMLNWAITQANTPRLSEEKIKLSEAYAKRDLLIKESAIALGLASIPSSPEGLDREKRRGNIDKDIGELRPIVDGQEESRQKMKALIKRRHEVHENCVLDAVRLQDNAIMPAEGEEEEPYINPEELKQFILQYHYHKLSVFRQIESRRMEFGAHVPYVVTHAMVDQMIRNEIIRMMLPGKPPVQAK